MPLDNEGEDFLALDEPFQASDTNPPGSDSFPEIVDDGGPVAAFPSDETTQVKSSDEEGQLPEEFDPKHRDAFNGLMFIGALTSSFTFLGHKIKIKTIGIDDLLEVGLITAKYKGTLGESRAYSTAMVAASIISIDGKPLPQPLTTDPADTPLSNSFEYVRTYYFPPVVDAIYLEYLELEAQVERIIASMGKVSG